LGRRRPNALQKTVDQGRRSARYRRSSGPGAAIRAARFTGKSDVNNLKERLEDLDKEGIDLQFIYPSFLLHVNAWPDGVLAMGVCRAYNTWLAEACSRAPDRLKAVGVVSLQDAQGAATELGRLRELEVNAVMINGTVGASDSTS